MRKVFLPLILFAFFCSTKATGQNIHLAHNDYTIQLPEGSVNFAFNEKRIIIKFQDGFSEDAIIQYLNSSGYFEPYSADIKKPHPVVYCPVLKEGKSYDEVAAAVNANANVGYVAPVLLYRKDNTEQTLYDLFYVGLKEDGDIAHLRNMGQQLNFEVGEQFANQKNVYTCRINKNSAGNTLEIAKYLQSLNKFKFAEPDFIYTLKLHTSDPLYANQWGINNTGQYSGTPGADMEVVNAWGIQTGSSGISVAIHDCWGSAAQFTHSDVSFAATYDAVGTGFNSSGFTGDAHGINCAGIIGATGNNNVGTVGVAYGVQLKAVKIGTITSSGGSFTTSGTIRANATIWSYTNADIISNSTGGGSSITILDNAISDALIYGRSNAGTLFCSSSGNSNTTTIGYPSSNANTIAVGATSNCDQRKNPASCDGETWWGCDYGTGLDVGAPGVWWTSTDIAGSSGYNSGDYMTNFNGTSSACPAAAGVLALMYSNNPTLSAANARWALETTCEKVTGYIYTANVSGQPNGTWNNELGYGRVNAYNAVQAVNCTGATNDNCANAITLPLNSSCTYTNGNLCRATQSIAPSTCSGWTANRAPDVWYTVTPSGTSGTGVTLTCVSGASTDVVLGIYSGSCGGLTLIQCVDATTTGGTETMTVTGLTSGTTYYVRVYDWDGSTLNTGFQICATQCGPATMAITPAGPVTICSPNTQTLTVSNPCTGCTYAWSGGGTGTTKVISATSSTTVTATNSCGTSATSNSVSVTVNPLPVVPTVTPAGPVTICAPNTQTLTISNPCTGCTFAWSGGGTGTTKVISATSSTTVTATNSCGTSANSNSVSVTVNPLPVVPTVTPTGPVTICSPNTQTLTISNPCTGCTFNWSGGGTGTTNVVSATSTNTVTATNSCGTSANSNSVSVTVNPLPVTPVLTPAGPVNLCTGGSQVLTISNPCTGCTYNWSNGGTGTTQTVNAAGNYTATSTNSCGTSSASNSVAVTMTAAPTAPTVTPAGPISFCIGQSQLLSISNPCTGCTFLWSNGDADDSTTVTTAGNYTATATNMCGTSANSNSVAVTILPQPVVPTITPAGPLAICSSNPATLTISNPCTGCTFDWSNSGTGTTQAISTTGTYTATSTNTCGTSAASNAVTVNVTPQPNNPTSATATQNAICNGFSTTLNVNGTLSTGATWRWYTASCGGTLAGTGASITVSPTATTTYYVRAENGICNSSCAQVTITVNQPPVANAGTNQTICSGSSVQIGAPFVSGNTYSWSPATGLNNPNFAQPTASPTVTTTYVLTRTINATGCQDTAHVTITVNALPNANAGPNQVMCSGYPTTLGSPYVNGYMYSWAPATGLNSTVVAMPVTTTTTPITYTLTVTNQGTQCVSSDQVSLTINPLPTADAGPTVAVAQGFGSTIGGSPTGTGLGPLSYSWMPNVDLNNSTLANPFSTPGGTITYTVTVTDGNSCMQEDTMTIVVIPPCAPPTAAFTATPVMGNCPLTVNFTDASTTNGTVTYNWLIDVDGNLISYTVPNPSVMYTLQGSYSAQLIVTDTCGSDTLLMPNYINVTCPVSVPNVTATNTIDIYPNPATEMLNIKSASIANGDYHVTLQNVLGQIVFNRDIKVTAGELQEKLSLAPFANGVYTLQIVGNGVQVAKKIEKR